MDIAVLDAIQQHLRTPLLDQIMLLATHLGDLALVWLVAGAVLVAQPRYRRWGVAVLLAVVATAILGMFVLKPLFGRARPFVAYEFAGLLMHAEHLEAVHGVGPHTISVPRIKRADDIDPDVFDNGLSDELFAKVIACIRIAVPYTGMIISTRESQQVRERALGLGISQISGASRTSVGGYEEEERPHDSEQFDVSDQRSLDEVVHWLMQLGFIPSFCTACYREGRTGDRFMSLCKSGQILNCCHPNALMTLAEYLVDYASEDTRRVGMELIQEELKKIPRDKVREIAAEHIKDICSSNRRDFRF